MKGYLHEGLPRPLTHLPGAQLTWVFASNDLLGFYVENAEGKYFDISMT